MLRSEKNWRGGVLTALLAAVMALALLPTQALAVWRTYYGEAKFYDALPSGDEVLVGTQSFTYRVETDKGYDEWPSWAGLDVSPNNYWSTAPNPEHHLGYTFVGWRYNNYVIEIGSWESRNSIDTNSYPNLYAVWEKNTYTVTFDTGEGGSAVAPQEIDKANPTPATKPADPTREGYRFNGWVDAANAAFDFSTTITADTTVHAMWVKTWDVTFDLAGGTGTADAQAVDDNDTATAPADPTREGYDFLGWFGEDGEEYDFSTPVTADVALAAKWSEQVFEMSASATEVSFDPAEAGYGPVAAQTLTVTNTGNQPLAITSIEVPEGFEFTANVRTRATGYGTLEPGDSLDIAVRPVDGLEPGDYEGDLVVTSDGGEVARVALAFNVAEGDPEPGVDPEPGDPSDGGDPADDGEPAADPKPADPKPAGTEPATTVTTTVTTTTVTTAAKAKVPATGDPASAAGLVALLGVMASAAGVATRRR